MRSLYRFAALAVIPVLLATACTAATSSSDLNGFSITVPTDSLNVPIGASRTTNITIYRYGTFVGDVAFSTTSLPNDVTVSFDPAIVPSGSSQTVMTIKVASTALPGTSGSLGIRATGPGYRPVLVVAQVGTSTPTTLRAPLSLSRMIASPISIPE